MKGTTLLLIAIVVTVIGFIPLVILQSLARKKVMTEYHYNVAVHVDYLWASLIFGRYADGHTVSALVYKHKIIWAVKTINWMFNDGLHCASAYEYEFVTKPNLTLKVNDGQE